MSEAPRKAVEVYYAYASEDEALQKQLTEHLSNLRRRGYITEWNPHKHLAGVEIEHEISKRINSADIILLLVSPTFLASDYHYDTEIQRAMERHEANTARVIPILLRPTDYEGALFAKLALLPSNGQAITTWRNRDEAFLDVTKGIRTIIEEWNNPSLNVPSHTQQHWYVPYRRNLYFTGQDHLLRQLHDTLKHKRPIALTQPQAINGLGGIGKTQFALEYAYRYHDTYHAIFWVNADSLESLIRDFAAIANLLLLPQKEVQDQSIIIKAVKNWLDAHDQWLLIFDNADDITIIDDFLPHLTRGSILLTTRAQALGTHGESIEIKPMEHADGVLFLLRRARLLSLEAALEQASQSDCRDAEKLVSELGGLPLALDQAGAYVEETGCGITGYLERYQKHCTTLLGRRGSLVTDHPESVATTWSLSFEKVTLRNPIAATLLQCCAFLYPDAIPEELLVDIVRISEPSSQSLDLIALDDVIETLRAYSLVHRHSKTNTLSIHRLVQVVLRGTIPEEQQRQKIEQITRSIDNVFPSGEPTTWSLCERYISHVEIIASLGQQMSVTIPETKSILDKAANYFKERGRYSEAIPLKQQALSIQEQTWGSNHPDTAASLNDLAYLYKAQGKYVKAEPLYQRSLAIRKKALGPYHPDVAQSLNNIAELYIAQGKITEARPLHEQALAIFIQAFGSYHLSIAMGFNNLAYDFIYLRQYDMAEPLLQQALAIIEQAFGSNHHYTATCLNSLAYLYKEQGKLDKAEPLYQCTLIINEQLRPDHPETAANLGNLAGVYKDQGRYDEAESLYQRALAIDEQVLNSNHPDTAIALNNLANLYYDQGRYNEAEPLYQRALAIDEQILGHDHPVTKKIRDNYATVLLKKQQDKQ